MSSIQHTTSTSTVASRSGGALVPTNSVTTLDGVTVRTRIDPALTVDEVVRQLVTSPTLRQNGSPSQYALRDDTDELVTNDNLRRKIKSRVNLKLVNAPAQEAREIAEKLKYRHEKSIRLTLFSLQKYIREEQFSTEFLNHNGLAELVAVIEETTGNTLAYALTAMQNLMELPYGWSTLDSAFILRVVQILSSPNSPINVCRPATAILKKLVEADPHSAANPAAASSSTAPPAPPPDSIHRYGFGAVCEQMRKERGFLETVVNRLGSADTAMAQYSMNLINALLTHATDARWDEFIGDLERLNVRKAVVRLMSLHEIDDLTSCILDFQANILRVTVRKQYTAVDPDADATHALALRAIWEASRLEEEVDEHGEIVKWRKLGFETEDIPHEFRDEGVLGLECLRSFVELDTDFSMLMLEQLSRPAEKRCPIAKASNEVVELLLNHWRAFAPGYSTTTTFQPFFLDFQKVHSLATHFFVRMWAESGAAVNEDFTRVSDLVRSQIKASLRNEHVRQWHEVESDFNCEYQKVRDRQMQELELEDKILSKVPVRNLRAKLYKESYEFVRQQRIQCLLQGAWFVNAVPVDAPPPRNPHRKPQRPWRFMRLDNALKYLHYVDSAVKFPVRNGLEDLPERIDISVISEIATGTCAPPPNVLRESSDLPSSSPPGPSPLSFSLLSAHEGSLADQIAPDQSRWADWTDGLNMLRRDGGHVSSKETAGFVHALTEIGLKIKLLDLSAELVDLPDGLTAGPPPASSDFFFSDIVSG
ncbi:ELMO/CED-12 family-domain-containing protein [Ephemerocybe angulata]|uniref:ELMO/CED-12 family-domain-containing protein n=1 Tax=Ephemerocybe angulata TaxID=980116 RepID=A0A8H6MAY2_9AGAR|nr:ELMO/CED-12 family-domain-containing protein [Tulosesus angulatus]